jgi:hypothetical protein
MRRAWICVSLMVGCGGLGAPSPGDGGGLSDEAPPPPCEAALSIDRSIVNLGTLDPGATGVGTVTLTNSGCSPSGDVTITTSAGVIATGCAGPLAGGASCTITVTAVPTATGAFSGTLWISANPGIGPTPFQVVVIATLYPYPLFMVSPYAFDLGPTPLGLRLPLLEMFVSSRAGLTELTVAASGPDVSVEAATTTCGSDLPAGNRCVVSASFRASSVGHKSDAIMIAGGGPAGRVVTVPIVANVVTGVFLVIDPSTTQGGSAFAGQTSTPVTFVVANRGDSTSEPLLVTLTGPDAAEFLAASDCTTLAPLGTCTVAVVFQPFPGSVGTKTATLEVSHFGTSYSAVAVPLTGQVQPPL